MYQPVLGIKEKLMQSLLLSLMLTAATAMRLYRKITVVIVAVVTTVRFFSGVETRPWVLKHGPAPPDLLVALTP